MVAAHGENVFATTASFFAISSIFRNLAKMKEFQENEGELVVLLSALHSTRRC